MVNKGILTKKVGKRIKELRESKGIKQFELAEKIDIEPTNLSKIENGVYLPREDKLFKIANVLEIEIKELFDVGHVKKREDILEEIENILQNSKDNELAFFYRFLKSYKELV